MRDQRPNILVVVADQLAASALGAYGNRVTRAPTLDRLASEGVVFEHAYCASPLCVPSRGSLLTSMLPSRSGAYDNGAELAASVPTFAHAPTRARLPHGAGGQDALHRARPAARVRGAGDLGRLSGGPRLGARLDARVRPAPALVPRHVERATGRARARLAAARLRRGGRVPRAARDRRQRSRRRPPTAAARRVLHASRTIPTRSRGGCWESYADVEIEPPAVPSLPLAEQDPHSRRLLAMFEHDRFPADADRTRAARRAYAAAISLVDEHVASLLATLEDVGMADDTMVVVCSDHGDMLGERGLWYKMSFFDGSARVPLVVHHPGRVARAAREPAGLAARRRPDARGARRRLAGRRAPATLDGRSLTGLLRGSGEQSSRPVLGEYLAEGVNEPQVMVRDGAYKLIRCPGDPDLLYDLDHDPNELDNLATDRRGAAALERLGAIADERWDLPELRARVLASQRSRRLVAASARDRPHHALGSPRPGRCARPLHRHGPRLLERARTGPARGRGLPVKAARS